MTSRVKITLACVLVLGLGVAGAPATGHTAGDPAVLSFAIFGAGSSGTTNAGELSVVVDPPTGDPLVGGNGTLELDKSAKVPGARASLNMVLGQNVVVGAGGIIANGNVTIGTGSTVAGDLDVGGTLTPVAFTPGGAKRVGVTANTFSPLTLPDPLAFVASADPADDRTAGPGATITLAPGTYRHLTTTGGSTHTVNFSSGTYIFASITTAKPTTFNFNVSGGDIIIVVTGNVVLGENHTTTLIGGTARKSFLETKGTFVAGKFATWPGTIFSTKSTLPTEFGIAFGENSQIVGALYSNEQIRLAKNSALTFEVADAFVARFETLPSPPPPVLDCAIHGEGSGSDDDTTTIFENVQILSGLVCGNRSVLIAKDAAAVGIRAGVNVILGELASVGQNILANGRVSLGQGASVLGNVDAGDVFLAPSATISGAINIPGAGFGGHALPDALVFAASTNPADDRSVGKNGTLNLSPGMYRDLTTGEVATLKLSAGTYVFRNVTLGKGTTMQVDVAGGDVIVLVQGDFSLGELNTVAIKDGSAKDLFIEVKGTARLGKGTAWLGTIYSTKSDAPDLHGIVVGEVNTVVGALYSKQQVYVGKGSSVAKEVADAFAARF